MKNATTDQEILESLQSRGYHYFFKGQHVQKEVALWYQSKGKKAEIMEGKKKCDIILDKTWLIDIASATIGKNGKYCFNSRHEEYDYLIFVALDKPRMPMHILTPAPEDRYKRAFSLTEDMVNDGLDIKFLGFLR